jgi:Golgi SNAP receptor complex protein 2
MLLTEVLPEDTRRLHTLEGQLGELESTGSASLASDMSLGIQDMENRLKDLELLVKKETNKPHREDMRRRVQHMHSTFSHVQSSYDSIIRRKGINKWDWQRKELFGGANSNADSTVIDLEMAENTSLNRSNQMLDDYISTGRGAYEELLSQREKLKSAQRKVYDIFNMLGISNSIMRAVERREQTDSVIVFGGMAVVTLLLLVIWIYVK